MKAGWSTLPRPTPCEVIDLAGDPGLEPPGSTTDVSLRSQTVTGGGGLRSALARAFLAAVLGAILLPTPGYAAEYQVRVVDRAYQPAVVKIQAGDTVVWRWAWENASHHTVTALDGRFDSDGECPKVALCRGPGNDFQRKFPDPGIYAYRCKVHAYMLGRVEVEEAPPQQPPETPPAPASGDQPGPQAQGQTRPAPPADRQQQPSGGPPSSQGGRPPGPRMAAMPGLSYTKAQDAPSAPRSIPPAVAPPRDPLSVLPEGGPPPLVPEAPPDPPPELALDVPARPSGPSKGLVVGIAVATLLVTAGAFGKFVLFRPPWS